MSMVSQDHVQILYIFPMDKTKREGKPSHFPRVLWDRQLMEFCIPFLQSLLTSSRKCVPNRLSAREKSQREETLPLMKGTRVRELPRWLNGKNKQTNKQKLPANAGDTGDASSVPCSGRSSGEGNGNPLQYSCLGNPMDRGAWWVHGVAKESDMTEHLATQCAHTRMRRLFLKTRKFVSIKNTLP